MAIISVGTFTIYNTSGKYLKKTYFYDTVTDEITGPILSANNYPVPYLKPGDIVLNICEGFDKYVFSIQSASPYISVAKTINSVECNFNPTPISSEITAIKNIGYIEPIYLKKFNIKDNSENGGKYLSLAESVGFYSSSTFNVGNNVTFKLYGPGRDTLLLDSSGKLTSINVIEKQLPVIQPPIVVRDIYATLTYENGTLPDDYTEDINSDIVINFHNGPILNDNTKLFIDDIIINYVKSKIVNNQVSIEQFNIRCINGDRFVIEYGALLYKKLSIKPTYLSNMGNNYGIASRSFMIDGGVDSGISSGINETITDIDIGAGANRDITYGYEIVAGNGYLIN